MKIGKRRSSIIRLIETNNISNQEELLDLLKNENFDTTQPTLSRDLKALKVVKQAGTDGRYIYALPDLNIEEDEKEKEQNKIPLSEILSVDFSGNLAVLKTRPGFANGVASIIDSYELHEIIGTIAGDDTILLICREDISNDDLLTALDNIIPDIKSK